MNVLIIGSGGREHALAWKASQSPIADHVFVAPGNAGTYQEPNISNVDIDALDIPKLINFAKTNQVGLTIVGPEAPLVAGVVDAFEAEDLVIFGPVKGAAQLEGSKSFSKDFLAKYNIPTASYQTFEAVEPAVEYVRQQNLPIVIKADGLAAGKGVIIAETLDQAIDTIKDMLANNKFGDAGSRVVIESFLVGEEASFIAMVDGETVVPFASSQDHKAAYEGDTGPNTGGMGAYSPAPVVTEALHERIMEEVMKPTVEGMKAEGYPYKGFLYAGIMVTEDGSPMVLEFNCRFGDPETQPIMLRLQSDLVDLCQKGAKGQLTNEICQFTDQVALGVVLAADGYPNSYPKGDTISGLPSSSTADSSSKVFHAGTAFNDQNQVVTNGGRVLCATALGETVTEAQAFAYELVNQISWNGMTYRKDIGHRAISREQLLDDPDHDA